MTDVTFSLNKAFEFSFQDKMKNNIISTLSKNPKDQLNTDIKLQTDVIDNNFILSLCSNNFSIGDIWGEKNEELNKRERRETFLGFKNSNEEIENAIMEDEIIHAKRNYFPEHSFHITFNYALSLLFGKIFRNLSFRTPQNASPKILPLILDVPAFLFTKMIGTSAILKPSL